MSIPVAGRGGFTLIELLVVVLVLGVLAMLGMLKYTDLRYTAKAAAVTGDIRSITVGAFNYQADQQAWPPDAGAGVIPPGLAEYLPGMDFNREDYTLDWDNFGAGGSDYIIGVTVTSTNAAFMKKLQRNLGTKYPFFSAGGGLTYIIVDMSGIS